MTLLEASVGQKVHTRGARIAGIVACVPKQVINNNHFFSRFGEGAVNDVVKMIGVGSRRWVAPDTTTADLCSLAAKKLIEGLGWPVDSLDGILFVSQTPDYILPATACALHGRLGLRTGAVAFDVNLGCSAYPYALWLAMTMVQSGLANRLLVAVGDTSSRLVDMDDRSTAMLFGDAGTVTAIEKSTPTDDASLAHFIMGTDGVGAHNLIVPGGRFKSGVKVDPRFSGRKPECLFMDGGEVFNFTLKAVPPLIAACIATANHPIASYSGFLFHQANLFLIKHLIKKAKLPPQTVPVNIDRYGNCGSASIPLLMTTELSTSLRTGSQRLALFGFGVGYSWASASLNVGPLSCIETIEL